MNITGVPEGTPRLIYPIPGISYLVCRYLFLDISKRLVRYPTPNSRSALKNVAPNGIPGTYDGGDVPSMAGVAGVHMRLPRQMALTRPGGREHRVIDPQQLNRFLCHSYSLRAAGYS